MKVKSLLIPILAVLLSAGCQGTNPGGHMEGGAGSGAKMARTEKDHDQGKEEKEAVVKKAGKPAPKAMSADHSCCPNP